MKIINKLKEFFGLGCELNVLEKALVEAVTEKLPERLQEVLTDQIRHFNRVSRVLVNDERLGYGDTLFYWIENGKSQLNYPRKFEVKSQEATLAEVEIACDDGNIICAAFMLVNGVFCNIQYRSPVHQYNPKGQYRIQSVRIAEDFQK